MNNKSLGLILPPTLALFLSACGGGGTTDSIDNTPTVTKQPRQVEAENWQSARLIQTETTLQNAVEVIGTTLVINTTTLDIAEGDHLQIYLNTDNRPETGYQFPNLAWEESGVDFLIEDGDLFKSTANNSGWNWNMNIGAIDYAVNENIATAKIDLALIGDLCGTLKIGVMTRDEFWDIKSFSPAATKMQTYEIRYCNTKIEDTIKPNIKLLGENPLNLTIGSEFDDPGATASDNIDGNITNLITVASTVNTAVAGNYKVTYRVSDLAGNRASITRSVIVTDTDQNKDIVIDGNSSDWNDIATLTSTANGILKVTDDAEKLYILVTSSNLGENTQLLLDTDNKSSTGLDLSTQINDWVAGADYMIENNSLDKSKSNIGWSWNYDVASIVYFKTADTLEVAINKSNLQPLANKISIGFVSRSTDWNTNYIVPAKSLPTYTLAFPVMLNPIVANNDSATTTSDSYKTINVLANDSLPANTPITLTIVDQPTSGTASIVNNKVRYMPNANYSGTVTITYQVSDNAGNKDNADIKVIVTRPPPNSAPMAKNDSATTNGIKLKTINVLANDVDPDGDDLAITGFTQPSNGIVTELNGKLRYKPNATFSGRDRFSYTISDGNDGIDSATVTITVPENNAPNAVEDSTATDFNKPVTVDVLANDTDPDGDTLSVIPGSVAALTLGKATLNADGTITFDPQNNVASLSIFYTVTDGRGGTDSAVLTIASTDPADNNESYPTVSNEYVTTPVNTPIFIDVLANDFDSDGDTLSIDMVDDPANGTTKKVTRNGIAGILYTPDTGFRGVDIFYYGVPDGRGNNGSGFVEVTVE